MITYVAFLRGINVGGHKLIKMEELRRIFNIPGFKNVRTYIQSGNVLFEGKEGEEVPFTRKIEQKLRKALGYEVKVFLRTIPELKNIVKQNPFPPHGENATLYVSFLSESPDTDRKRLMQALSNEFETFHISKREMYSLIRKDTPKPLFSNNSLEKRLGTSATTRNWSTVNKILGLSPLLDKG